MDLRDWIIGDLRSLRAKLDGGVLGLIPPERRTERADGGGIAPVYVLWHLARHHDVAVNGVLRGAGEVVEGWTGRLGIDEDLWRGLAEGEDADLVDVLDSESVGAYALDVCDATAGWLDQHGLPPMDHRPDTTAAPACHRHPRGPFRLALLHVGGQAHRMVPAVERGGPRLQPSGRVGVHPQPHGAQPLLEPDRPSGVRPSR